VTQQLISALFDRWAGKPILVIGGGPSVNKDLQEKYLPITPACVISANDHGMKQTRFPVDLLVNCDKIHCLLRTPMEKILKPYNVPIVSRHAWANYRLCDWVLQGNTGMTAIAVAAALGGSPVIVTGIDMWKGGRVYFHGAPPAPAAQCKSRRRVSGGVSRRDKEKVLPLKRFCAGARIRPISGPLTEWFPQYDPAETVKPSTPVGYRLKLENELDEVQCEVVRAFPFSSHDWVRPGQRLALSSFEYEKPEWRTNVRRVDTPG
jgi:hypothetical protein